MIHTLLKENLDRYNLLIISIDNYLLDGIYFSRNTLFSTKCQDIAPNNIANGTE